MERDRPDIQAQLAAFADGTLPEAQRDQLLGRIESSPGLGRDAEAQRQAVAILGSLDGVKAPAALHGSVQSMIADAPRRRRARRLPALRLAAAGALAAIAVVALAVALSTGSPSAPSVQQASRVALRPATLSAPAQSATRRGVLARSVDGIAYPYWQDSLGWRASGTRVDHLGGRTVTTVFYRPQHAAHASVERIGYTIVAGRALPIPSGGTQVSKGGIDFHVLASQGTTVVTWRRDGHTCILVAARGARGAMLVRLASWQ